MPLELPQMALSGCCSGAQPPQRLSRNSVRHLLGSRAHLGQPNRRQRLSGPISVLALETIEIERDTLTLTSVSAFKSLIP